MLSQINQNACTQLDHFTSMYSILDIRLWESWHFPIVWNRESTGEISILTVLIKPHPLINFCLKLWRCCFWDLTFVSYLIIAHDPSIFYFSCSLNFLLLIARVIEEDCDLLLNNSITKETNFGQRYWHKFAHKIHSTVWNHQHPILSSVISMVSSLWAGRWGGGNVPYLYHDRYFTEVCSELNLQWVYWVAKDWAELSLQQQVR